MTVPGQRQLHAEIILADGPVDVRVAAAVQAIERFPDTHKVLVFFNSRKEVDVGAKHFRQGEFEHAAVFGHHGSLSKEKREETEERFKSDNRAICVATMTLEVGIDIGDIDLVICMDPPYSLSSFLQRIGRGCRRLAGKTRVLCVARDRASGLLFEALIRQAGLGLPVGPLKPFRRSVLVQQVLAYLKQVDRNCRTVKQLIAVFGTPHLPAATEACVQDVLADLVRQKLLENAGEVYQPASLGWDFIESNRIYSNMAPTPVEVTLVDADTGGSIANVARTQGDTVRVAGRDYQVLPGGTAGEIRVRGTTGAADSPKYHTVRLPYSADLGAALAGYLGLDRSCLALVTSGGSTVVFTWLGKLLNNALAATLKSLKRKVKIGAFALIIEEIQSADVLKLIQSAVGQVLKDNPLGATKVEHMADLGAHFKELSDTQRQAARRDWLDREYLTRWSDNLKDVSTVEMDSELGGKLHELAKV